MLLFVSALPAFIPIPIGGAIAGPLVVLIGAIAGRPAAAVAARLHRPPRSAPRGAGALRPRISPWLARLERLIRPRLASLDHRAAATFTGLLLVLLGVLTSLPIPFTTFLFGAMA